MRKYSFINYKNMSKDGFKLRTTKTIEAIRSISIKKKKVEPLEIRIGHDNIDLTVIGIGWNPSNSPLNCYKVENMKNVLKEMKTKNENGFLAFTKLMKKTFDNENNKNLYYWLFDKKNDIPKIDGYRDSTSIEVMIGELYEKYIDLVKNKFQSYIETIKEITVWDMDNLLKAYSEQYFDFNLNPEIKNKLIEKTLHKLNEIEITVDDVDEMIPGKRAKIIELPKLKIEKIKKNIVMINFEKEQDIILEKELNEPLCLHYVKWKNINRLSKTNSEGKMPHINATVSWQEVVDKWFKLELNINA
jgi:hypothetical protein